MRRRLREQRRLREALLLDLGALVYELHRQGKRAPELLQEKAAELSVVDDEVRELEARLEGVLPEPAEPRDAEETAEEHEQLTEEHELEDEPDDALAEHEEPRA